MNTAPFMILTMHFIPKTMLCDILKENETTFRAGEYLLRDIPVLPVKYSFSLFVKNDPYPYN